MLGHTPLSPQDGGLEIETVKNTFFSLKLSSNGGQVFYFRCIMDKLFLLEVFIPSSNLQSHRWTFAFQPIHKLENTGNAQWLLIWLLSTGNDDRTLKKKIKILAYTYSVQLLSHVWLCDPMNCSTPGLPVHHQLPEFTQTHVHWVGNAI